MVCLVGEGQEINKGEAGISEWLDALAAEYRRWRVYVPPRLPSGDDGVSGSLAFRAQRLVPLTDPALHLAVSVRSFRAKGLSDFIAAILQEDASAALALHRALQEFPLFRLGRKACSSGQKLMKATGS